LAKSKALKASELVEQARNTALGRHKGAGDGGDSSTKS